MNYFIAFHCHWKTNASNIEGVTLVESRLEEVGSFGYKQGGTDTDVKVRMGKELHSYSWRTSGTQ